MRVGRQSTVLPSVYTSIETDIALAGLEGPVDSCIVCIHIISASYPVVNMFAFSCCIRTVRNADLNAELISAHEIGPVPSLLDLVIVAESSRVHQASQWIASSIRANRIHLSSIVSRSNVELGLIYIADNLDVLVCLDHLCTIDRSRRNDSGAMCASCAVCDSFSFRVTDSLARFR